MYSCKKIVLLGENIFIEKFEKFNVIGTIGTSNSPEIKKYPYEFLKELPKDTKIIIDDDGWDDKRIFEFNGKIQEFGLIIGDDYIYSSMLEGKLCTNVIYALVDENKARFYDLVKKIAGKKELVILHGNCQTHVLRNMLISNQEFKNKFIICETPRLWIEEDEEQWELFFDSGVLKVVNYLIIQEISPGNVWGYKKSLEYICSQISDACCVIRIPKLFFMGYFPQLKITHMKNKVSFYGGKISWLDNSVCIDKEIIAWILDDSSGRFMTAEEIVEIISSDDYFNLDKLKQAVELELKEFEIREKNVDIKMCDFLKENYNKFLMFVTNVHPTRRVLEELARRILRRLRIMDMSIECSKDEIQPPMPSENIFTIYPSVLKAFGFSERTYNLHIALWGVELPLLLGIEPELDEFVEKNKKNDKKYSMTIQMNFKQYMLFSIRVLQAAIHV